MVRKNGELCLYDRNPLVRVPPAGPGESATYVCRTCRRKFAKDERYKLTPIAGEAADMSRLARIAMDMRSRAVPAGG